MRWYAGKDILAVVRDREPASLWRLHAPAGRQALRDLVRGFAGLAPSHTLTCTNSSHVGDG
jgi:hypothetical protein